MNRTVVALVVVAAGVFLATSPASAAPGVRTGTYAAFTPATMSLATGFPTAVIATTDPALTAASTATLPATTPFGGIYGSSSARTHLSLHPVSTTVESSTTMVFETPTPIGDWSFALGDVDADSVQISGLDAAGLPITGAQLGEQGPFNSSPAGTDLPLWDETTSTLTGNTLNSDGATDWFTPTVSLGSLTFTVTRLSGAPVIYLWMAATTASLTGIVTDPSGTPVPGATIVLTDASGNVPPGGGQTQVSGDDGGFEFAEVFASDVTLTPSAPGFETGAPVAVSPEDGAYPSVISLATGDSTLVSPSAPQLAATGDHGASMIAIGGGVLALGLVLLLARRRSAGAR